LHHANNRLHMVKEELCILRQQKEFRVKNADVERINEEIRKNDEDYIKKLQYEKDAGKRQRQRDAEIAKKQQDEEEIVNK